MAAMSEAAFRDIYEHHYDAIARFCLRRLPAVDAYDAVSEVFLVVWRRMDHLPSPDERVPWLYGIANNTVRNARRTSRRRFRLASRLSDEPRYPAPGPEVHVIRREEDQRLIATIAALAPADQEVILLRAYEELSIQQISLVLGCSVEAARKRLQRALARLRAAVDSARPANSGVHPRAIPEGGER